MKLVWYITLASVIAMCGCRTNTIQVIETNGDGKALSSPSDFGNESYIWESWIYPDVRK